MIKFIRSRKNIPVIIAVCIAIAITLVFLAPEEQTLGVTIKLVFMHGALMWVSLLMYTLSAVFSFTYLINSKDKYFVWANSILWTGIIILALTGFLGMITAKITWGSIVWSEPRMIMLEKILLASVLVVVINTLLSNQKFKSFLSLALTGTLWWLLMTTEKIIHPNNPIFSSDSLAIKLFPLAITFFIGIAAIQLARWFTRFSGV